MSVRRLRGSSAVDGLVHQQHLRLHGEDGCDGGHPLFAAGHFMVVPVAEIFHVQLRERFLRPLLRGGAAQAVVHGAEDHIVEHGGHEHLVVGVLQHIAELPRTSGRVFRVTGMPSTVMLPV